MNNNQPLVTVAIPTYNRCEMLKKALDSAVNQTYKNIEILISDNCSDDETQALCREYVKKDSRIKYFRQENNIGMEKNGSYLLNKARGKYFAGICDDDWLSENFIEEATKKMENSSDYISVGASTCIYNENYELISKNFSRSFDSEDYNTRVVQLLTNMMNLRICLIFTRTALCKELFKYAKGRYCEDQLICVKALYYGKIAILPNITYYKINNGCTKNLETLVKTFNLEGFTEENFMEKLAQCHADAVLNDEFYNDKLTLEQRKELAEKIIATFKKTYGKKIKLKNVLKYMWRHPLFIFRRDFYAILKKGLGL